MSDTKPICPVCGREMENNGFRWICVHGDSTKDRGCFSGPVDVPDGSKVRAQIAAMEQRALANALGVIDRDMQGLPLPGAIERAMEQRVHTHSGASGAQPEVMPAFEHTCGTCMYSNNAEDKWPCKDCRTTMENGWKCNWTAKSAHVDGVPIKYGYCPEKLMPEQQYRGRDTNGCGHPDEQPITAKPTCGQCAYRLAESATVSGYGSKKCDVCKTEPACPAFVAAERSEKS